MNTQTPLTDANQEDARNVALEFTCRNPPPNEGENVMVVPAEFARGLEREIEALKRGEFICAKCGIRKDSDHEKGDF